MLLTLVTPLLNEAVNTVFALAGKGSTASTRYQTVLSCSSCKSPARLQTVSLQARRMHPFPCITSATCIKSIWILTATVQYNDPPRK